MFDGEGFFNSFAFENMLSELVKFEYRPTFSSDALFYFFEYTDPHDILNHLASYITKLNKIITHIKNHKEETLNFLSDEYKTIVNIIFSHHLEHYQVELTWAKETLDCLNQNSENR